jgi:hypothetical protein
MKENMNKLDQLFEKAFAGFEESPPAAVKSTVFKRILPFRTWQMIRKYVFVSTVLIMVGGVTYFSGAFSMMKYDKLALQSKSFERQQNNNQINQISKPANNCITPKKVADVTNLVLNKSENKPPLNQQEQIINTKQKINTLKNDKTNTSQLTTSISNKNSTPPQENIIESSAFKTGNSSEMRINKVVQHGNILTVTRLNNINGFITDQANNITLTSIDNSNERKNRKTPLLWSVGFNLGHSLIQSGIIKTYEQVSDDNIVIDSKLNFPSGFAGINVRGEKRHLYFDFGLQYTNFSEKISTNQLLYNSQEYQNISFLGQTAVIDTNGSYWHYFYISDSTIRIIDSVKTWRTDTNVITVYDTTFAQRFDTLKNPAWVNSYSLFEIPLNIGWMKNFGRVNLGLSTGPIFSLLVGTKGKMPYHKTNQTELIAIKQEFHQFRLGVSWQMSGLINYQFSNRMLVEFSPYYRHTLLPFKSSGTSSTLNNNSFGLQLGIRYYF